MDTIQTHEKQVNVITKNKQYNLKWNDIDTVIITNRRPLLYTGALGMTLLVLIINYLIGIPEYSLPIMLITLMITITTVIKHPYKYAIKIRTNNSQTINLKPHDYQTYQAIYHIYQHPETRHIDSRTAGLNLAIFGTAVLLLIG